MGTNDFQVLFERVASLETDHHYQTKKIDEIHKVLLGNGQPGMVAEWNQWKGSMKFFKVIVSVLLTVMGLVIAFLSHLK